MTDCEMRDLSGKIEGSDLEFAWVDRLARHRWAVLAAIMVISLLAAVWDFNPLMERWGDNAEFIVLARSIVQGRWMQLINQPDSPRSDKFPFGFPLLLASVEWLAPGNMLAMKVFVLVLYVVAMPVVYVLLRRYLAVFPALLAATLALLNPLLLPFSHQVMSEIPYLLASSLALLFLERAEEPAEGGGTRHLVVGALLAVAATTIRPVGPAVFGGAILWYLVRRQYRRALLVAGVYMGVLLGLHLLGAGVVGNFYVKEAMKLNPNLPELGQFTLSQAVERVLGNFKAYGLVFVPETIFPIPKMLRPDRPGIFFSIPLPLMVLSAGVILLGFIRLALRQTLPSFYLLAYWAFLSLWPSSIPQPRYLMPIIPFLLLCFFCGLSTTIRFFFRWPRRLQPSAASLGMGVFIVTAAMMITLHLLTLYEVRGDRREYPPAWKSYFEAAEWLRSHSPLEGIVVARKPFLAHLVSERKTIGFPFSHNPEVVIEHIMRFRATFIIVDSLELPGTTRYLIPAIDAHRERFELAYSTPTVPPTYVLRIKEWTDNRPFKDPSSSP